MNEWITELWNQHGYLLVPIGWLVLSALLNWAFRFKSAEQWVAFSEKNPKLATVLRLIRALGVDPVKALNSAKSLSDKKADESKDSLRTVVREVFDEVLERLGEDGKKKLLEGEKDDDEDEAGEEEKEE